jgi:hypothetical protein
LVREQMGQGMPAHFDRVALEIDQVFVDSFDGTKV